MNCSSQGSCRVKNVGANAVPRYTILARPTNQGLQSSLNSVPSPSVSSCVTLATESTTSSSSVLNCNQVLTSEETSVVESACLMFDSAQQMSSQCVPTSTVQCFGTVADAAIMKNVGQPVNGTSSVPSSWMPEKTHACRVNELARFNKIPLQFALVAEEGPPHQKTFYVQLTLGEEVYHGSASSMKRAQHNVASMALERTRYPFPPPKPNRRQISAAALNLIDTNAPEAVGDTVVDNSNFVQNTSATAVASPSTAGVLQQTDDSNNTLEEQTTHNVEKTEHPTKSVINELQELAVKIGLLVSYSITDESPAPCSHYRIVCTCGSLVTQGSGPNKKFAKKHAAAQMLDELKKVAFSVPPERTDCTSAMKSHVKKKKTRSIVKQLSPTAHAHEATDVSNAVRLYQVQQARRGSLPVYNEIGLRGGNFVTEVAVDEVTCSGVGRTKKLSKQDAASKMLAMLGFPVNMKDNSNDSDIQTSSLSEPLAVPAADLAVLANDMTVPLAVPLTVPLTTGMPAKSALRKSNTGSSCEKKVTFIEPEISQEVNASHHSPVRFQPQHDGSPTSSSCTNNSDKPSANVFHFRSGQPGKVQILKRPSKEDSNPLLVQKTPEPKPTSVLDDMTDASCQSSIQRLQRFAASLHVNVQFTDLPRVSGTSEYVSIVSVLMNPPLVNHGVGTTLESARDSAAHDALEMLKEFGIIQSLNNVHLQADIRTNEH